MRAHAVLAALLMLCACRKDPASKPESKDPASASTQGTDGKSASQPGKPPADEGIDVPTEEDFEEAVTTQITPETDLQKELDQLEKQIGD
jgi:hypothetical protein